MILDSEAGDDSNNKGNIIQLHQLASTDFIKKSEREEIKHAKDPDESGIPEALDG